MSDESKYYRIQRIGDGTPDNPYRPALDGVDAVWGVQSAGDDETSMVVLVTAAEQVHAAIVALGAEPV